MTHEGPLRDGWLVAALVYLAVVALAYGCLKFYDEPVQECLRKKVLGDKMQQLKIADSLK